VKGHDLGVSAGLEYERLLFQIRRERYRAGEYNEHSAEGTVPIGTQQVGIASSDSQVLDASLASVRRSRESCAAGSISIRS
jgi:hypothetical protein